MPDTPPYERFSCKEFLKLFQRKNSILIFFSKMSFRAQLPSPVHKIDFLLRIFETFETLIAAHEKFLTDEFENLLKNWFLVPALI